MTKWFENTSVKLINGSDFQDKEPWNLRDSRCAFILFFANWCGHCENLKPEYIKFADIAQFIRVYAVDSEAESALMERLKNKNSPVQIRGFPTVWIYNNGKPLQEYSGNRTWQALLQKAKNVCNENCKCDKQKIQHVRKQLTKRDAVATRKRVKNI